MRDPWDRFAWWQSPALFGAPVGPAATSANSSGGILGNTAGRKSGHGPAQDGAAGEAGDVVGWAHGCLISIA